MSYITLPSKEGWFVDIVCNNGVKISTTLLAKDYPTKQDAETYINHIYRITKDDCVQYEILDAII